jgi:hypothetical protein
MHNSTISTPIGSRSGDASCIVRDVRIINRVMQNMLNQSDRMKVEMARITNDKRTLRPKAPCL